MPAAATAVTSLAAYAPRLLSSSAAAAEGTTPNTSTSSSSSSRHTGRTAAGSLGTTMRLPPGDRRAEIDAMSFEQLRAFADEQLTIRNSQGEYLMLSLIKQARSAQDVQDAVGLVRRNHLTRGRLQQLHPFSPHLLSALLKAGKDAGLGAAFGVQLLQQAHELGLWVSRGSCEDVIKWAAKEGDFAGVSRAWLCAAALVGDPSWQKQPAWWRLQGAQQQQQQQEGEQQQQSGPGPGQQLAWASPGLMRVYALALAQWLQQGGTSPRHAVLLRQQLAELCDELGARGASVPPNLTAALREPEAAAAEATEGGDAAADSAVDDGQEPAAEDKES